MKNINFQLKGTTLTIKVDLAKEFKYPSTSGKNIIIASTEGNASFRAAKNAR